MREIPRAKLDPAARCIYVRGAMWVYAILPSGARATFAWGAPDDADAREALATWDADATPVRIPSLFDASRLERVEPAVLQRIHDFLQRTRADGQARVSRQAVVFPRTLAGTVIAGYYAVYHPPFESRTFVDRDEALRWLGCDDAERAMVDALLAQVGDAGDADLGSLRRVLASEPLEGMSLDIAARALALSPRTLQRRLAAVGTCFADELTRAQVARAQRLMIETDRKLTAIALEVGCASPSTFSELFRRLTGMSPSDWRQERQGR